MRNISAKETNNGGVFPLSRCFKARPSKESERKGVLLLFSWAERREEKKRGGPVIHAESEKKEQCPWVVRETGKKKSPLSKPGEKKGRGRHPGLMGRIFGKRMGTTLAFCKGEKKEAGNDVRRANV